MTSLLHLTAKVSIFASCGKFCISLTVIFLNPSNILLSLNSAKIFSSSPVNLDSESNALSLFPPSFIISSIQAYFLSSIIPCLTLSYCKSWLNFRSSGKGYL